MLSGVVSVPFMVGLPGFGGDQYKDEGPGMGDSQPECAVSAVSTLERKPRTCPIRGFGVGAVMSLKYPLRSAGGSGFKLREK